MWICIFLSHRKNRWPRGCLISIPCPVKCARCIGDYHRPPNIQLEGCRRALETHTPFSPSRSRYSPTNRPWLSFPVALPASPSRSFHNSSFICCLTYLLKAAGKCETLSLDPTAVGCRITHMRSASSLYRPISTFNWTKSHQQWL